MNNNPALQLDIQTVLSHYPYDFSQVTISPLGNGNINTTYKLVTAEFEFVLQQINHHIFSEPFALSTNTKKINNHLLTQKKQGDYPFLVPQQILSKQGESCIKQGSNYWRLMAFIKGSYTIEQLESTEQAAMVANAFAQFSLALESLNPAELHVVIKNFHDVNLRVKQLKNAAQHNRKARLSQCQSLADFCLSQTKFIAKVNQLSRQLPLRIIHNDTKINNLLFAANHRPCAVIDLDTCMPGFLMHDFGDMARSCCNNLAEDDKNIERMILKLDTFEALIQNYQAAFGDKITTVEKESLIIGAQLLPLTLGMRFLTDYLNGDTYFHITRENQNFDRAHNQLNLFKLMCSANEKLIELAK